MVASRLHTQAGTLVARGVRAAFQFMQAAVCGSPRLILCGAPICDVSFSFDLLARLLSASYRPTEDYQMGGQAFGSKRAGLYCSDEDSDAEGATATSSLDARAAKARVSGEKNSNRLPSLLASMQRHLSSFPASCPHTW